METVLLEKKQILVVDDEPNLRRVLSAQLERDGYDVHTAEDGEQALALLREHHIDLVITDLRMPQRRRHGALAQDRGFRRAGAGRDDHRARHRRHRRRGAEDRRLRLHHQALRSGRGAHHRQEGAAHAAISRRPRRRGRRRACPKAGATASSAQSPSLVDVYAVLDRVADTPTTVLITGESGTGKELVARALHENSSRRDKPFIKVNCAAIPQDLMESELFGYERGAFTGAVGSQARTLRARERRHAVPRRDRRDPRRDAGEAAARAAGERVRARRRRQDDPRRRAPRRRDQQRSEEGDRGGRVPRGSLLSPERRADSPAAAARARARTSRCSSSTSSRSSTRA